MTQKETIKNALREKLKDLSKEELINIIADLSAEYVMLQAMERKVILPSETICSQPLRDDLQEILNATKDSMPVYKPSIIGMAESEIIKTVKEEYE